MYIRLCIQNIIRYEERNEIYNKKLCLRIEYNEIKKLRIFKQIQFILYCHDHIYV